MSLTTVHFDAESHNKELLTGITYEFSLNEKTISRVTDKHAIEALSIQHYSHLTPSILNQLPKLRLVITRTVGTDHLDLQLLKSHNIAVYHVPDYGAYNIAEHALGLMLAGCRNTITANSDTHQGNFNFAPFFGTALHGKTIGVIGTGKIGLAFIKLLQGFEVSVIAYDVFQNAEAAKSFGFSYVPLEELLKKSDAISIHVPLLPETKHLINNEAMVTMKQGIVLVNTSRGGVVDTQALIKNIAKFKAICLDVVEDEEHFSKNNPLLKFENVIITPHSAFYTDDALSNMARETHNCVQKFLTGDKTGRVV